MPLKRVLKNKELYIVLLRHQWTLVILGILFSLGASMIYPIHPDEEVFIRVAETMIGGGLPYRDVFDNKPPGIYLVLAPFVALFGSNLIILRLIPFGLNIIIGWLLYLLCRTILHRREGVLISFLYLIVSPFYQANFIVTEVPMTVCLLAGTRLAWTYKKNGVTRAFWVGIWLGIAILFKQTAVVYSLIMPLLLLAPRKRYSIRKSIKLFGLYMAGLLVPIIFIILYLISANILDISYYQIIEYNIRSYHRASLSEIALFIPQILFPIVILWAFIKLFIKKTKIKAYHFYFISLFIVASIPLLLFRPYHHYWIPVLPYILLLL